MQGTISRGRFTVAASATLASLAVIKARRGRRSSPTSTRATSRSITRFNVRMKNAGRPSNARPGAGSNVQMFPNNQLGGDTQALQQLRSGALEFFTLDARHLAVGRPGGRDSGGRIRVQELG